jgi:biopolymer transport protein ExbB/TolQ
VQPVHDLLSLIADAFLFPTLLGTLLAFAYGTFILGQFLAEIADRRVNVRSVRTLFAQGPTPDVLRQQAWKGYWARFAAAQDRFAAGSDLMDKLVSDLEHEMTVRVDRLGIISKVGPMLGLIGTLIPLKPALAGLARGDMQAMGANLEIGFTTTVVGLLVGGTAYAISVVYRNWFQQDLTNFHYLLAQWATEEQHETGLAQRVEAVRR